MTTFKLPRILRTCNPNTIATLERALKAHEHGGYVDYKGRPHHVVSIKYKRELGVVYAEATLKQVEYPK